MGCIKDIISPELLIDNPVKFQQKTVDSVSFDKCNSSVFRNGLTYVEFRHCLQDRICKIFAIFNSAVFGNISNRTLSATSLNGGLPPLVQNNMSTSTLPSPWEELSLSNS